MKIVKKGFMPNVTPIQIEDWSENYSCHAPSDLLAAYPTAMKSRPAAWCPYYPEQGRSFRVELQFINKKAAEQAFDDLASGKTTLLDYTAYMTHPEYAECLK